MLGEYQISLKIIMKKRYLPLGWSEGLKVRGTCHMAFRHGVCVSWCLFASFLASKSTLSEPFPCEKQSNYKYKHKPRTGYKTLVVMSAVNSTSRFALGFRGRAADFSADFYTNWGDFYQALSVCSLQQWNVNKMGEYYWISNWENDARIKLLK